jgi:CheY-like chemotaxis protein
MRTEKSSEEQPMNRAKIMVVDDDPDLRQALSLRLRANNFDTVNACDGYSAIALAQKERPHLIILDLGLPAGDGFAVLKNLQEYPALSVIPVIVLTARDPEGNEKRTLESGAIAFFQEARRQRRVAGSDSRQSAGWLRRGWRLAIVTVPIPGGQGREGERLCMSTTRGRWPIRGTTRFAGKNRDMFPASRSGCSGSYALDRSLPGASPLISVCEECQLWSVARRSRAKRL